MGMFDNLYKRHLTIFDLFARKLLVITFIIFIATIIFIDPLIKENKEDLQRLELIANILQKENDELKADLEKLIDGVLEESEDGEKS